jgi:hypothetical protein
LYLRVVGWQTRSIETGMRGLRREDAATALVIARGETRRLRRKRIQSFNIFLEVH